MAPLGPTAHHCTPQFPTRQRPRRPDVPASVEDVEVTALSTGSPTSTGNPTGPASPAQPQHPAVRGFRPGSGPTFSSKLSGNSSPGLTRNAHEESVKCIRYPNCGHYSRAHPGDQNPPPDPARVTTPRRPPWFPSTPAACSDRPVIAHRPQRGAARSDTCHLTSTASRPPRWRAGSKVGHGARRGIRAVSGLDGGPGRPAGPPCDLGPSRRQDAGYGFTWPLPRQRRISAATRRTV
jgi:hypothetical protein